MGCCLTTTKTKPKTHNTLPPESIKETVKQVVPLTPKTIQTIQPEEEFSSKTFVPMKTNNNPVAETASEVSSESYTYSNYTASLSAATTTTIGTGVELDEEGEVTQKVNKVTHVKMVSRRRKDRGVCPPSLSTARKPIVRSNNNNNNICLKKRSGTQCSRSTTLPGNQNVVLGNVDNNNNNNNTIGLKKRSGTQCSRPITLPNNRNVVLGNVVGREHCVRRLRSRVVREVKKGSLVENSDNWVPVKVRENEVKVTLKKEGVGVTRVPGKEKEKEIGESLENPLVSMECFIFL